jgi:delta24(24(1))-sterol reductase
MKTFSLQFSFLFSCRYCLEKANGELVLPLSVASLQGHCSSFIELLSVKGVPSLLTWGAYTVFFVVQIVLAAVMPGMVMYGVPIDGGKRLKYLCNGYLCYYFCIAGCFVVHYFGIFPITHMADNYGEYLVASMIIANVTTVYWYFYGIIMTPNEARSGIVIYDFFMGTILYPRLGIVDIKMVAECRWSWLTLFILTLSCAVKQYEQLGYVSREMGVMVVAHWLYSNATVKGEHCIPCTWDMFHERFGWMLNFWNITGVPFLYCFQSYYILKNQESITANSPVWFVAFIYTLLVVGYYIFDTANSQKASWKMPGLKRNTFPQLPWAQLKDPIRCIRTPKGDLIVDGWYAFARKMQYTGDIMMALSWGLACGFGSSLPYFYVVFFIAMITHRQWRDEIRCKDKYGELWDIYTKTVPNVFIPGASFVHWCLTGEMPVVGKEITLALRAEEVTANTQPKVDSISTIKN